MPALDFLVFKFGFSTFWDGVQLN